MNKIIKQRKVFITVMFLAALVCQTVFASGAAESVSGAIGEKEYGNTGFTALEISGVSDFTVTEADDFNVKVSANESLLDEIEVIQRGKTLSRFSARFSQICCRSGSFR